MVKSQAGRADASAETVHGSPRWVSAPRMMAQGRCRYGCAASLTGCDAGSAPLAAGAAALSAALV